MSETVLRYCPTCHKWYRVWKSQTLCPNGQHRMNVREDD